MIDLRDEYRVISKFLCGYQLKIPALQTQLVMGKSKSADTPLLFLVKTA
ncbi:MAG: hypothetical protein RRZ24_05715 [Clostridia bacterium]